MCGAVWTVVVLAGAAAGEVRVWSEAERRYPQADWIPPGADRSEFAVVSSQPFAVVDRTEKPTRDQRQAWHRHRGVFPTAEAAWRRQRSLATRERPWTTAQAASDDAVLERYPGTPQLWSPYTEDPAANRNDKKPLFTPDTGFLLEHESRH